MISGLWGNYFSNTGFVVNFVRVSGVKWLLSERVAQRLLTGKDRHIASVRGNRWRLIRWDQKTLETQESVPGNAYEMTDNKGTLWRPHGAEERNSMEIIRRNKIPMLSPKFSHKHHELWQDFKQFIKVYA